MKIIKETEQEKRRPRWVNVLMFIGIASIIVGIVVGAYVGITTMYKGKKETPATPEYTEQTAETSKQTPEERIMEVMGQAQWGMTYEEVQKLYKSPSQKVIATADGVSVYRWAVRMGEPFQGMQYLYLTFDHNQLVKMEIVTPRDYDLTDSKGKPHLPSIGLPARIEDKPNWDGTSADDSMASTPSADSTAVRSAAVQAAKKKQDMPIVTPVPPVSLVP